MGRSFFRLPSYSVFNYQPRHYDPEQERREEKRRQMRMEQGKDPDYNADASTEERIRGRMKYRIQPIKKSKRNSNLRLLVILSALLLLAYLLLAI